MDVGLKDGFEAVNEINGLYLEYSTYKSKKDERYKEVFDAIRSKTSCFKFSNWEFFLKKVFCYLCANHPQIHKCNPVIEYLTNDLGKITQKKVPNFEAF